MASITILPAELLDVICDFVDRKDLCSLRLVCKPLGSRAYHYLAPAFREIYLGLTSDGLQFLKELAGSEILRGHVTAFWIIPNLFDAQYDLNIDQFCHVLDQHKAPTEDQTASKRVKIRRTIEQNIAENRSNGPRATLGRRASPVEEELYQVYQGAVLDHFRIVVEPPGMDCPGTVLPDEDHSRIRTLLQHTLATCLPCFPVLRSVGIRRYADHSPFRITVRGIKRLGSRLGFNPVEPWPPRDRPDVAPFSWGRSFKVDLFDMPVFATVTAAIAEAGMSIQIEELETGALMAHTANQPNLASLSLQPIFSHLRRLTVTVASSHIETRMREKLQQEEDKLLPLTRGYSACNARTTTIDQNDEHQTLRRQAQQQKLLQMLAAAVPALEDLSLSLPITSRLPGHSHMHALSSWMSGLDLTDSHFAWMAHNFQFAALHTLSLDNLAIAVSDFTSFLQTAQPTLRKLSILRVHWTKGRVVDMSRTEKGEIVKVAESLCRLICGHLQDCFSLESLMLETWYYQASPILVIDPDHRRACRSLTRSCTTHTSLPVCYGTERMISFEKWLDQLIFIARVPRVSPMFL